MLKTEVRKNCIIAHIDYGKSILADRLLEETHTVTDNQMMDQVPDDMDLERERGTTIKSHPIQVKYASKDGYEMFRSLFVESSSFSDIDLQLPDVEIVTVRVVESSPLVRKSLAEIELRKKYGVTVLAIR